MVHCQRLVEELSVASEPYRTALASAHDQETDSYWTGKIEADITGVHSGANLTLGFRPVAATNGTLDLWPHAQGMQMRPLVPTNLF